MKSISKPLFEGIIAVIIFGTLPVSIKFVSAEPMTLGIFRLMSAIIIMTPFILKRKIEIREALRDWKILLIIGLCFGLHWLTYFYSIKISSASIGAIGVATFGVHLLLLGALFLGTRFKFLDFLAVCLAVIGCCFLVPSFTLQDQNTLGLVLSVFSGFLYALLPIFHKKLSHLSTVIRTFFQFVFALIIFLPFYSKTDWHLSFQAWLGMIYLGSVCTVIAHTLWVRATTELSPVTSSIIYYAYVPISLFLNNAILGESFNVKTLFGIFLVALGNLIAFVWGSAFRNLYTRPNKTLPEINRS